MLVIVPRIPSPERKRLSAIRGSEKPGVAQPQGEVGAEIGVDEEHEPDRRDDIPDGPPGHLERQEDDPPAEDGVDRSNPAAYPFGELRILDDVVDDDPRHDEHEQEIEDARPALGRPRSEFEKGEADDEGPQEIESHVGLLGDEPEEGGVEKIETVDGAEGLQSGIVPPSSFRFPPPSPNRPSSCRYLTILPKMLIQFSHNSAAPRANRRTGTRLPCAGTIRRTVESVNPFVSASANQSVDDGFVKRSDLADAVVEYDLPVEIDRGIPVHRVDVVRGQHLSPDGEVAADPRMAVPQAAQVLEIGRRESRFGIEADAEFGIVVGLLVVQGFEDLTAAWRRPSRPGRRPPSLP